MRVCSMKKHATNFPTSMLPCVWEERRRDKVLRERNLPEDQTDTWKLKPQHTETKIKEKSQDQPGQRIGTETGIKVKFAFEESKVIWITLTFWRKQNLKPEPGPSQRARIQIFLAYSLQEFLFFKNRYLYLVWCLKKKKKKGNYCYFPLSPKIEEAVAFCIYYTEKHLRTMN